MTDNNKILLDYFNGDELAANVWESKYKYNNEVDPNDMHIRLASEFARMEENHWQMEAENAKNVNKNALSLYGRKRSFNKLTQETIFNYFKDFKYIIPQGSVMSILGTDRVASCSNCFVIESPKDSYHSILKADEELVQLMKRRGGVGLDLSNLRPRGSSVSNAAKTSTGAASFMERYSNSTREVAQGGRRGALMLTMDVRHPDIKEFINAKKDRTKVTGANISVMLRDDFMKAVKKDKNYTLRFPCNASIDEAKVAKEVNAKELYDELVYNAWDNAEPGQLFIDRMLDYGPDGVYDKYKTVSTNPCQPSFATVLTEDGIRTFADIEEGSVIWSESGWTTVTKKWSTGVKSVYKYGTSANRFIGTENHRVKSSNKKVEVKDAVSIDVLSGKTTRNSLLVPSVIMDGIMIGDGSVHLSSKTKEYLTIGANDIDYFSDNDIRHLILGEHASKKGMAFKVSTSVTYEELPRLHKRCIPERYYKGSQVIVKSFLRGLYSANGSVVSKRVTLKSTSLLLIEQVQDMLSSIGIRSYFTTNKEKDIQWPNGLYKSKTSYDLSISTDRHIFQREIGFIQDYKNEKLKKTLINAVLKKSSKTGKILNKEYLGEYEVFDITVDNKEHTYWTGGCNVSNCSELSMGEKDACRLMCMNLYSLVRNPYSQNAFIDENKLYEVAYEQQRLADDLIDMEISQIDRILLKIEKEGSPVEKSLWEGIRENCRNGRRTGCGVTGLADMLAALGMKYDSKKAMQTIEWVMKVKMRAELDCTIDLAILRGPFEDWDPLLESVLDMEGDLLGSNSFFSMVATEFKEQWLRMLTYGRRNISWSTVAPTGTVSLMTQTSSGIEPLFQPFYTRRKKVNPSEPDVRVDFVDQSGDSWTEFAVLHPKFKDWIELNWEELMGDSIGSAEALSKESLKELYEKSPWYGSSANDIDWQKRVLIQSSIQKYTSHGISSTINLPSSATKEEVYNIYMSAWASGCKGVTVYRDGCRTGVLVTDTNAKTFSQKDATKRPKDLKCKIDTVKVKGTPFTVVVGELDSKPYEVFAIQGLESTVKSGTITKMQGGKYNVYNEDGDLFDRNISGDLTDEQAAITRLISTALRHGTDVKYICEQLGKTHGDLTDFSKAISRVLKTYIADQLIHGETCGSCGGTNLIYEEGCKRCKDCGNSKC